MEDQRQVPFQVFMVIVRNNGLPDIWREIGLAVPAAATDKLSVALNRSAFKPGVMIKPERGTLCGRPLPLETVG